MSDEALSLTELLAIHTKMTDGPWDTVQFSPDVKPGDSYPVVVAHCDGDWRRVAACDNVLRAHEDSYGIAATHNAMPALLEVARAALVLRDVKKAAAKSRGEWSRNPDDDPKRWEDLERDDRALHAASLAYDAALAKVRL